MTDNFELKLFSYQLFIRMYIFDTPRLRYSTESVENYVENDVKNMKECAKWLIENDPECMYEDAEKYITFINEARELNKLFNKAGSAARDEIVEEDGCECGINFGKDEELTKKVQDKNS